MSVISEAILDDAGGCSGTRCPVALVSVNGGISELCDPDWRPGKGDKAPRRV